MSQNDWAGEPVPAGLPDVAELARLAGQFFAALPSSSVSARADAPKSSMRGAPAAEPATPRAPHKTPSPPAPSPSAVSPVLGSSPSQAPSAPISSGLTSSPHPSASHLTPRLPEPREGLAHHPGGFYFLAHAPDALARSRQSRPGTGQANESIAAQAFSLPGAPALAALLAGDQRIATLDSRQSSPFVYGDAPATAAQSWESPIVRATRASFDVEAVRRDFPILSERVNGQPLVWFDNAATTHKPQAVIDRLAHFYRHENSNIHRAAHELAARATDAYEGAREIVRRFIGARLAEEIIFVRGATEAINLVAQSWGRAHVGAGDEIIVSRLEHHANIVPWQQLAADKGARIRVIPVDDSGQVILEQFAQLLNGRTRIVAVTQVSNALGTVVPVQQIIAMAHAAGVPVLVDGAQSVSHMRVNVAALDADFFVFSGHKIFAPTGIGVVYGKREILEAMPPWQGGGNMIADVTFERTLYNAPPTRFEAGTGNIADAVGLGAALEYVERIGIDNIGQYEHGLLEYATHLMCQIPAVRLIGTARDKASVLSFVLEGYSTEEVGREFNRVGIAVRTGHHCAQPILRRFGLETTVRPSLAFYNTCEEVDKMVEAVKRLVRARR
jgi:cysteine desulfurase/selenocysteine lyase